MSKAQRSKSEAASRREQLRRAKRSQRERERQAGRVHVQLTLPKRTADKLAVARRATDFPRLLDSALDRVVIRIAEYEQLRDLAWNRADEYILAQEAFQLYERNWRFIEPDRLDHAERALIERLRTEFGGGVINA